MEKSAVLEGIISIKAAIDSGNREIYTVFADEKKIKERDRKAVRFISFLKQNGIDFEYKSRAEIDALSPDGGNSHGGFIAFASERKYEDFSVLLEKIVRENSYAVFLDGIEDPFNFGYCMRNLYAFGAGGFIVPQRNWLSAAGTVARASAGASELCGVAISPDDVAACEVIKQKGADIVCAALSQSSVPIYDFLPSNPFVLFIGGEKRGISKVFMENADKVVHIPYANPNARYSLPAASAAAVFGSHIGFSLSGKKGV